MKALKDDLIDLKQFEVQDKMEKVKVWKFYQIMNLINGKKCLAKVSYKNTKKFNKARLIFFLQEVKIMSRINHPSILKFYGYNLINFKNKPKPIMIMEFASEFSLSSFLSKTNEESDFLSKFNDTKKLINIYGIASAMSFLHSHNIIIRSFKLKQIFLDNNLYPKLSGFGKSFELSQNSDENLSTNFSTVRGAKRYASPEILSSLKYSKASDVYAFAILMSEIMNGKISYESHYRLDDFVIKVLNEGQRPKIDESVADCYRNLIQKCWAVNPEDRPTFEYIVNELKSNVDFITESVDAEEFHKYVQFLDETVTSFSEPKPHPKLEEFVENNIHKFDKTKIDLKFRGPSFEGGYFDLTNYKLDELLFEKDGYNIYAAYELNEQPLKFKEKVIKAFDKDDREEEDMGSFYSKFFCTQVYSKEINDFCQHDIINFSRKLSILSRINHPAILNFVGYSPVDFENKRKPVIFTECATESSDEFEFYSEYTKRLINIYGIASAMSYLHSYGIIHRDLKPSNIIFDGNNMPKLTGFDISKEINEELIEESNKIKGTPVYLAPEVYTNQEYSKASDVYSFGIVMYKIMTGKNPFLNMLKPNEIKHAICDERKRPEFKHPIAKAYRNLIERCWSHDPKSRPTFDEILKELKTNPEFITEEVDSVDFFEYVKFIDEFPTTFNESKRIKDFDESISSSIHTFTPIISYPDLKDMYETEMNDLSFNYDFFSFKDFAKSDGPFYIHTIASGSFYNVKVFRAFKFEKYAIKDINHKLEDCSRSEIKNFIREMKIIPRLNHPSILKYIGYMPSKPNYCFSSIIMEYMPNKSIYENKLDDTQKLICFYGIAVGMSYLHSNNIIHRDLKPSNVFLDKNLYPKISGFNISKEINRDGISISKQLKGTPAYLSPEIYLRGEYSKLSDVYSFGLLMYEVLNDKRPFKDTMSPKEIKKTICEEGANLPIPETICEPYRNLIERCLSQDTRVRPTFESIVNELRNNPAFITQDVNENKYRKYIQYIDESPISYDSTKQVSYTENSLRNIAFKYAENNIKINIRSIYETELDNILLDYNFIDIHNYEKQKLIFENDDYKIKTILDKQTGKVFQVKKFKKNVKSLLDYSKYFSKSDFCNEINTYFELNHPSFLRLIGYSPLDFKNRCCPMFITEYGINGKLESVLELDMKNQNEMILNPTKRLIILYGIASAMSYLQSHNMIHGSLKPSNIYLDDFLFPRISDINKSEILSENPIPNPKNLNFISLNFNDIYESPEQCIFDVKCSTSDVYSFAFIAYQLISNELPFEELNYNLIRQIFVNGLRPEFKENVPECYRNDK